MNDFKAIFDPRRIGHLNLRNRLVMSLFPSNLADKGLVTEAMIEYYRRRAAGGAAMIVVEGPAVEGSHKLRLGDAAEPGLVRLGEAIHGEGAYALMQISHGGKAGANEVKSATGDSLVNSLAGPEIEELIRRFASLACRIKDVGFDGVEIQAGYGHLISQFLSPHFNKRSDEYGGRLANRSRFLFCVLKEVVSEVGPDFVVQVKLVADEFIPDGFRLPEAVQIASRLEKEGVHSIQITAGSRPTKKMAIPPHSLPPGVLVPFAVEFKGKVNVPVIVGGKIKDPVLAEEILTADKADFVSAARTFVADPDWPRKVEEGRLNDIRGCISCNDCTQKSKEPPQRRCVVNPELGRENELTNGIEKAGSTKRVWVVGGGPAGMQAAIVAAQRGHDVELFEKAPVLGGTFLLAPRAPFKDEVGEAIRYLEHQLRQSPVKISLSHEVTGGQVLSKRPDAVVVAVGAKPMRMAIPGTDRAGVRQAVDVWKGEFNGSGKVVIIGGGDLGCETADILSSKGREVTIVEMLEELLARTNKISRSDLLDRLRRQGVIFMSGSKVERVLERSVAVVQGQTKKNLAADSVIMALGSRSDDQLARELDGSGIEVFAVGDCAQPGHIGDAIYSAYWTAIEI